jgi:hypothetical protein
LFLLLQAVFRRRLVLALCGVAVAVVGALILVTANIPHMSYSPEAIAVNNLKQIALAMNIFTSESNRVPASLDEVTNRLGRGDFLIDPTTGKPFVYAAAGKKLDELQSNEALAYSLADKKGGHAVLFADGRVETVPGERFAELTNQKAPELALADQPASKRLVKATASAPVVAATPTPALPAINELEKQRTEIAASRSFVRTGSPNLQNQFRNASASAQTAPVLQSFQVQQSGGAVSVVDRDGSVYNGSVQLANGTTRNEPISAEAPATSPPPEVKVAQLTGNEQQAAQNYFFRVAGTNLTLRQNVVFTGNVLANNTAPQTAQSSNVLGVVVGRSAGGQLQQGAANTSQQNLLSNSRIVGTAVIDRTNRIEINAVPVTQ